MCVTPLTPHLISFRISDCLVARYTAWMSKNQPADDDNMVESTEEAEQEDDGEEAENSEEEEEDEEQDEDEDEANDGTPVLGNSSDEDSGKEEDKGDTTFGELSDNVSKALKEQAKAQASKGIKATKPPVARERSSASRSLSRSLSRPKTPPPITNTSKNLKRKASGPDGGDKKTKGGKKKSNSSPASGPVRKRQKGNGQDRRGERAHSMFLFDDWRACIVI
jgi:hypothetical protein